MKQALFSILFSVLIAHSASAQSRSIGAQKIVLDDANTGGKLTIEYNGAGNRTLDLEGVNPVPAGSLNLTLRHNGTGWDTTSMLQTLSNGVRTSGAVYRNVKQVTLADGDYQMLPDDTHIVLLSLQSGGNPIVLPSSPGLGREITIRLIGNVLLPAYISTGSGLMDGDVFPYHLGSNETVTFIFDGNNWWTLHKS
jgi:hypothetical protein